MTATVTIVTNEADNTVVVPNSAFTYSGSQSRVDVLDNGVVTPVQVQTGISDGSSTQIVSGLSTGRAVVTGSGSTSTAAKSSGASGGTSILPSGGPGGFAP
jgi:HlyD family secretion protein